MKRGLKASFGLTEKGAKDCIIPIIIRCLGINIMKTTRPFRHPSKGGEYERLPLLWRGAQGAGWIPDCRIILRKQNFVFFLFETVNPKAIVEFSTFWNR